ncbi:DUF1660 family phage protein [Halorubrum ezzemoulense]|uniref:DUF1660 family phage protein n=1 Tax=Halorubrum ezzemoulense TaxID=337243 RepID=UPI0034E0CF88
MSEQSTNGDSQLMEWQRLVPAERSRLRALMCRLVGHEWSKHLFRDGDTERDAVTCMRCDETRVKHGLDS